jgi:cytochrome d ubiquinol oxidase subunit I
VDSVLDLARWQFGIVTVYHSFFVPLTIGLSLVVALMETAWLVSKRPEWLRLTKFFGKLFLINLAMGVVTGIVQEFQFGMNWSDYSRFVGDVFGAPLAIEALLAFFLESTFIGLWIFGWDKLPRGLHAGCMWVVHLGTLASSWFILAANSWMQHPVGYRFNAETGRAELTDFWAVMANKVQVAAFPHVIGAAYMTGAAFVVGVSAWLLVRGRHEDRPLHRSSIRLGAWLLFGAGIIVAFTGDVQGKVMTDVQPMKMAAAEALWDTSDTCAPFSAFTIGTRDGTEKKWALEVPCVLSFLATGHFDRQVLGINELREQYRQEFGQDPGASYYTPDDYTPNIPVTYWTFRWMMGLGGAGAAGAALILWLTRKGRTPSLRWFAPLAVSVPLFVLFANSVGWIFTEMGRQPWVVFGLMTTRNAVSPGVSAGEVWTTLLSFSLLYLGLAVIEIGLLLRVIRKGPEEFVEPPSPSLRPPPDEADRPLTFAY